MLIVYLEFKCIVRMHKNMLFCVQMVDIVWNRSDWNFQLWSGLLFIYCKKKNPIYIYYLCFRSQNPLKYGAVNNKIYNFKSPQKTVTGNTHILI